MKFKTKVAYSAVLATLSLAAGTAQAAYLSEQGTGQVLLYPYYSVQGGMDTYVTVVNTTSRAKAVKVRFIEGRGSFEVLDFNLYLSAFDVWNAAVTTTDANNALAGAKIVTNDKSCTAPSIPAGGQAFRNTAYTGTSQVGMNQLGNGIERTREGYVEMIEMGVPDNTFAANTAQIPARTFEWSVTHNSAGVPNDCAWVQKQFAGLPVNALAPATLMTSTRTGGLIGTGTLINTKDGVDYSYDPVAIEDYNSTLTNLHYTPGSTSPSLNDAETTSAVIDGVSSSRRLLSTDWSFAAGGLPRIDAISAVLMRSNVMNEYTVNADLNAGTDWVVTFPTKRAYVSVNNQGGVAPATTRPFTMGAGPATSSSWLACEPAVFTRYNREEAVKGGSIDFSPSTTVGTSLCYESNVITFTNKNVLGSVNVKNNIDDVFSDGWIDLSFTAIGQSMTAPAVANTPAVAATYVGLPVIGFAVQKYVDNRFNGAVGNYGGSFAHKYVRTIR